MDAETAIAATWLTPIAYGELQAKGLDPAGYGIEFERDGDKWIVILHDKDVPVGARGVPTRVPTVEVIVRTIDHAVLKSYFAR